MKKKLLLLFALIAGFNLKTFATHDIGCSLTYKCVAPNTYQVTYSHYAWRSLSVHSPGTISLNIKAPGCNTGRVIPMQYQTDWVAGAVPLRGGIMPYRVSTLTATVTFTAAEAACKDWILSVNPNWTGMKSANLTGTDPAVSLYTESTLKLDGNINNSSPVFDIQNTPVLVAALHKPIILSVGASDPDGDSLVYRMVAPLMGPNQPLTTSFTSNQNPWYKSIVYDHPQGEYFFNPNPSPPFSNPLNPQGVHFPGLTTYSPDFPLLSYNVDWSTGQQIIPVQKYFVLDDLNGMLAFTPKDPGTLQSSAFQVAFQIDEYRKVNGIVTRIGSIRRETVIVIGDVPANYNPRLANPQVNNVPVQQFGSFTVGQGSTLSLSLDGFDANPADSVFLKTNAATALPGATYTVTPGQRQTITVNWTPTAAHVRSQPYFLRIWVKDNASPFAGEHVETIAIRVSNTGGVMAVNPTLESSTFLAFPNPFTEAVSFKLSAQTKTEAILIYNLLGQQVDEIPLQAFISGQQEIKWENASRFAKGTYLARLIADGKPVQVLKFTKQ